MVRTPLARAALAVAILAAVLALALAPRLARVPDDEMAPSFYAGDVVFVAGGAPRVGEVVAVVDPLDPSRWTLRRAEAIGGAIRYEDGAFHTVETERVLEMGRDDTHVVLREGDHLVRRLNRAVRWEMGETFVEDDHVFLGADARDEAVDSRWWGPLPVDAVQGRVVLRLGEPRHPWRGWIGR